MSRSKIQTEIRQRKPFRSKSQEASLALLRTADRVRRHFTQTIEPFGVTSQQYNVLRILRGSHPDALLTLEVARRMVETAPGITRLMDRLEAVGLIERQRGEEDRRKIFCRISNEGLDLLERMDETVNAVDDEVGRLLSRRELQTLIDLLDRIREEL